MSEQMTLREVIPPDAKSLLTFLKKVSQQSDFITFDEMKDVTVEEEKVALDAIYQSDYDEMIVAVFDSEIIGYCRVENYDDKKAEFGVVVDKEFWNNGIASYLLEDTLNWALDSPLNEIFLEVYKNNSIAIHIYQKYGFAVESEKEKTLVMKKMV
ncbi:GNAT family N-acetyltransferase [Companilactobacillus halodurans]|uniref:GNAT family N-acetyltransferase n=1 Tax=Companilactobacillus halodurans TaxID=2584183 RepID=A0A5P0ZRX3_9LACO|nr:GNAT family N-acetyltransferase [Companilactobacillus halodurans]MQS76815.1 GNAT family N-acetyltransferase [Companilactobacillus halodurans]MQS98256.1 GNAT family N-acetyltransferase [Companilactobacillus halodurans]